MVEHEAPVGIPSTPLRWRVRACRWLWRVLRFVWGTLLVGIVIATIANFNTTATDTPLAKLYLVHLAQTYPLPLWSGLGLLSALTLLSWLGSRERQTALAPPRSEQDRSHMLRRLRVRYEQIRAQFLQGAVQLELGLAERPAAVQNAVGLALRQPDQPDQLLAPRTTIIQAYELAQQELLILGEPGAGKSTLLVELARALVAEAEQDVTQPLPILLPLASWAERQHPLDEWLSEEIARLYDVPRRLSQQWVQAEQVLPLLDGLDEMEEDARPACIAAINTYHRQHLRPLVICSRTSEYDGATMHERLALHTAVVVQPLALKRVDAYLLNLGEPLAGLRAALQTNPLLREIVTTPLLLQLLILIYHGTSVRKLPLKEAQLYQQIWADYVQRMVERKGDLRRYPLFATVGWLRWLAHQVRQRNQTIFSEAFFSSFFEEDWLPMRQRNQYRWSVVLLNGLLIGLLGMLLGGLLVGLLGGLLVGLLGMLLGGLLTLLGTLLVLWYREKFTKTTEEAFERSGPLTDELNSRRPGWLYVWLLVGLFSGLLNWLLVGLLGGVLVGLLVGLLGGVLVGLLVGLLGGVLVEAIKSYAPRFWLARSGVFPWRVVPFLEDATARNFLRRVGGGYSFAHRLLLDYFADIDAQTLLTQEEAQTKSTPVQTKASTSADES